jgi:hypothetical protein
MPLRPFDRGFNAAVLHIASRLFPGGFDVSDDAPQTFDALTTQLRGGGRMVVWSGGSERTIFGDPAVNYAFRAWHDWCHWRGRHPFTPAGERACLRAQRRHLLALYGDGPRTRRWIALLTAEVLGQQRHFDRHGRFPDDQRAFVAAYLHDPEAALRAPA